jgi:CubicO group peptidase (beta-lactamase class C family)
MRKLVFILSLIFVLIIQNGFTQNDTEKKLDELLGKYTEMNLFSGTVLVAKDGKIIYEKAFGYSDVENKISNEIDTRFNLCSIGKTYTAVLIMQLVESGKLSLTEPIATYLPEYKIPNSDKITIHHLLTHTSGLFNYMAHSNYQKSIGDYKSIDDVMKLIEEQKLVFETPGEKVSYSNSGFIVLGKIIEKITGKRYGDYLKEKILNPLNMTNSILPDIGLVIAKNANGYLIGADSKVTKANTKVTAFSDGGLHTTVEDMLKYDQALYGTALLKEETKELMFAGGKDNLGKYRTSQFRNYSYGWIVSDIDGRRRIGHNGGIPGINTVFTRFPNDKITLIILSNYDGGAELVSKNIISIVFGENPEPIKLPLSFFIYNTIKDKGPKYFSDNFDNLIKENGYKINNDQVLNTIGYNFMQEDKLDEAIELFKVNVKLFPDVANCYDSLGEAYLKKGDKENARINYKRAFELDPNNKNAEEILKTLK